MIGMGGNTFRVALPGVLAGMPATRPIELVSSLPGVVAHATYIGLNGLPVVHGTPDGSFLTASVNGSLDGEYFSQDRATLLAAIGADRPSRTVSESVQAFPSAVAIDWTPASTGAQRAALVLGLAALVLAGNLLAVLPAAVAARTRPAAELRTE